MTKKETVTEPQLGMKVFHEDIYKGRELMEIVGLRKDQVELEGDWSGGTHLIPKEKDWMPIKGIFRLKKVCEYGAKSGGCPLPNVHCSYPDCEPYVNSDHYFVSGKKIEH